MVISMRLKFIAKTKTIILPITMKSKSMMNTLILSMNFMKMNIEDIGPKYFYPENQNIEGSQG